MKKLFCDIVFYLVFPLAIWNIGRDKIGAYYAMVFSGLPGLIYAFYGILKTKNYSVFGIFILISIIVGRIGDLLAKSPEGILWNGVYISFAFTAFYLITVIIKKPLGLYIFVDFASSQGYSRKESLEFLRKMEWFIYMQLLTILLAVSVLEGVLLKIWLINKLGVDGFNSMSVILSINGYIFWGFQILFCSFIGFKIRKTLETN